METRKMGDIIADGAPPKARRIVEAGRKSADAWHRFGDGGANLGPRDYFDYYAGRMNPQNSAVAALLDPQDDPEVQKAVERETRAHQMLAKPEKEAPSRSRKLAHLSNTRYVDELPSVLYKGMPRDSEPLNFASYIRGQASGNWKHADREREIFASITTSGDGAGLLPTTISSEIWYQLLGRAVITEAGSRVIMLANGSVQVPVEATAPSAAWVAEGAEISDSGGDFDTGSLSPHKIAFLVQVSNEMLLDAPQAADEYIRRSILNALSRGLNQGFLNGTGASNQPTGLLVGSPSYAVDKSSTDLDHDMLMQAYWDIVGAGGNPAGIKVIMAPQAAQWLDAIRENDGQTSEGGYLTASTPVKIPRVVTDTVAVSTGPPDSTKVLVGDFSEAVSVYSFGSMRMDIDTSFAFNKDSVVLRCVQRVDIGVRQSDLLVRLDGVQVSLGST